MAKPKACTVTVIRKQILSPNIQRIVLGGDSLSDFPDDCEGGYIKLMLSALEHSNTRLLEKLTPYLNSRKEIKRSYTVRRFDRSAQEITLDCVIHGDSGPACIWANHCRIGDQISISGPGQVKRVDHTADWFFITGDMTALAAISVNLEHLPPQAKGYAIIEIMCEEDKLNITTAEGIDIHWVINPHPDQANTLLADTVKSLTWLEGEPSVWVASEFETMRNLRRYFKQERQVNRDNLYISSYWKMGDTDEGNKLAKKNDPEAI